MKKRFPPPLYPCFLCLYPCWRCCPATGRPCDECGKDFFGTAYYGFSGTETYCEDCAKDYWMPPSLPELQKITQKRPLHGSNAM